MKDKYKELKKLLPKGKPFIKYDWVPLDELKIECLKAAQFLIEKEKQSLSSDLVNVRFDG